jgi:proteasome lid subunit RPN8/RPN11
MTIQISSSLLREIHKHGEAAYPDEGAGLLLGKQTGENKEIVRLLPLENARRSSERHNRYLLTAEDFLKAEFAAAEMGFDILGVFHSHPDHPNRPSAFDLEWALPYLSYIITSVMQGKATESLSWVLNEDRSNFLNEKLLHRTGSDPMFLTEK